MHSGTSHMRLLAMWSSASTLRKLHRPHAYLSLICLCLLPPPSHIFSRHPASRIPHPLPPFTCTGAAVSSGSLAPRYLWSNLRLRRRRAAGAEPRDLHEGPGQPHRHRLTADRLRRPRRGASRKRERELWRARGPRHALGPLRPDLGGRERVRPVLHMAPAQLFSPRNPPVGLPLCGRAPQPALPEPSTLSALAARRGSVRVGACS